MPTIERASFDLGVSATAFHWLNEDTALTKVAELLRPGGWWAMVWNVFGDNSRPDPFHEATKALLQRALRPFSGVPGYSVRSRCRSPHRSAGANRLFDAIEFQASAWPLVLDPDQTVALYATFSNINIRPDRKAILAELGRIARDEFHGSVTRNMTTSLYTARRRIHWRNTHGLTAGG